jgi:two-component system response regulator HydG
MPGSVLVVDDDERVRASVSRALSDQHTQVQTAESAEQAISMLAETPADVVITDLRLPGMNGIELLRLVRQRMPETEVVIITAYEDLPTVAAAMSAGAAEFLVKPLDLHKLRSLVGAVFRDRAAYAKSTAEAPASDGAAADTKLVGRHPAMVEAFKVVGQVAQTQASVVIRGESGTGKELIARAIHSLSPHAAEPFVAVDCTALAATLLESELFGHVRGAFTGATSDRKGRFALAGKGAIFLDEIGDTSPAFQAKLLRVLQEHEYYPVGSERAERTEARVIAATHRDLEQMVADGDFREDLFYRLSVVEIVVPPLRDRIEDIPPLATHLVEKAASAVGKARPVLAPETIRALEGHPWPGNVRELENCLTRAVVTTTGDVIRPEHVTFSQARTTSASGQVTLDDVEREHVVRTLEATGWHKTRTAELLGISRPRLDRLITKYGLVDTSSDGST